MKNIKKQAYRFIVLVIVLCTSFLSSDARVSLEQNKCPYLWARQSFHPSCFPQAYDSGVRMDRSPSIDTLPFLRSRKSTGKKSTPEPEPESTLFPDSKSYRLPYECKVTFDGKNPVTGERKKELEYEPLLSYTSPHLKTYLPGKDLLKAEGKLIKFSGGYTYLSMLFHWNAKNPQNAYGRLKAKGAIRFQLTSDKSITLYNNKESLWQKNDDQISHSMQASFLLHQKQVKLLEKYPIMKLTVYWERGFEEYPIYPITIFMNQLKCLEQ